MLVFYTLCFLFLIYFIFKKEGGFTTFLSVLGIITSIISIIAFLINTNDLSKNFLTYAEENGLNFKVHSNFIAELFAVFKYIGIIYGFIIAIYATKFKNADLSEYISITRSRQMSCKKLFSRLTWIGLFIYAGPILIILLIIAIAMLFTSPSIATSNNNSNKKQKK